MELGESKLKANLKKLDMKELMFYKNCLEALREQLISQLKTLKTALERCEETMYSLLRYEEARSAGGGNETLVPLTKQVLVPGLVGDGGVLVGLGSGYVVRMTCSEAVAYFRRQRRDVLQLKEAVIRRLAAGEVSLDTIAEVHAERIVNDYNNNNKREYEYD